MLMGSPGKKVSPKFWSERILKGKKGEKRAFQAERTASVEALRQRTWVS